MRIDLPFLPWSLTITGVRRPVWRPRITVWRLMAMIALLALPMLWLAAEGRRRDYLARAAFHRSAANAAEARIMRLVEQSEGLEIPSPGPNLGVISLKTVLDWEREGNPHPTARAIIREFHSLRDHSNLDIKYRLSAARPWFPASPAPTGP